MNKESHNLNYYLKCMFGGALACGSTHLFIVPLDVLKCKMQIDSNFSTGFKEGITKISKAHQLTLGWVPTLYGYSIQGAGKFGFYEIFKDFYKIIVGQKNAQKYRKIGWTLASASAQFFADLFLCPWEAIKLKIQLSRPGFQYPDSINKTSRKIKAEQTTLGFYKGIVPLWSRQIPYTAVKFVAFEQFVQFFYDYVFTQPKQTYSKSVQLSVTFTSGYLAGIICAIVSHPADTMVSKFYSQGKSSRSTMSNIALIYKQIGFKGLWAGLPTRILMIGTIAALQWWIYDSWKTFCGLQTTGGSSKKKQYKQDVSDQLII